MRTFLMSATACLLLGAPLAFAEETPSQAPAAATAAQAAPAAPATTPPAVSCVGAETIVYFEIGSTTVNADSQGALRELASARHSQCTNKITIVGHTDRRGSVARNQALALARADAVKQQLVALGVPESEIAISGQGESAPQSATEERLNRRVVVALEATPQVSLTTPPKAPGT